MNPVFNDKEIILEIKNLTVGYVDKPIIKDISFSLHRGEIKVLLGENGAGKTTTIYSILSLLPPWKGSVTLNTSKIGFVLEKTGMLSDLTIRENFRFFSELKGNRNSWEETIKLIKILGIDEYIDKKFKHLSSGMKKRAEIGRALLENPELLILDEPTEGIDAIGRYEVKQMIRNLSKIYGCSILLTTHNLFEAEDICQGFIILKNGKILFDETIQSIMNQGKNLESFYMEIMKK